MYTNHMSVTYGNANYQKKFDALRIIHESGLQPLKEAIACALRLRQTAQDIKDSLYHIQDEEARQIANATLCRATKDEFSAWIDVAEFVHAKPKHQIEVSGAVTLEQVLAASNGHIPIEAA
jgi:hypothetical protein